jgi:hypothetical protein
MPRTGWRKSVGRMCGSALGSRSAVTRRETRKLYLKSSQASIEGGLLRVPCSESLYVNGEWRTRSGLCCFGRESLTLQWLQSDEEFSIKGDRLRHYESSDDRDDKSHVTYCLMVPGPGGDLLLQYDNETIYYGGAGTRDSNQPDLWDILCRFREGRDVSRLLEENCRQAPSQGLAVEKTGIVSRANETLTLVHRVLFGWI